MKSMDIEAWVLRVVDQVKKGQPCEDSRVELKARWPEDPNKAARRIAAHANAIAGETILWIIGLDESQGVVGADYNELANWFPSVEKQFDGLAPSLRDINVPVDGKTLVAMLFDTDRIPFVVKNCAGGPIDFEVPWREGCRTRSAKREDLIRLLSPIASLPAVEYFDASITATRPPSSSPQSYNWNISAKLYIGPRDYQRIVIPCHKCKVGIKMGSFELETFERIWLEPRVNPNATYKKVESLTVACTKTEAVIDGPGVLDVKAQTTYHQQDGLPTSDADLTVSLSPAGNDKPISVTTKLQRVKARGQIDGNWVYDKS